MSFDAAREEFMGQSGSQLDPLAVEAFLAEEAVLREMVALKCDAGAAFGGAAKGGAEHA